MTVAFAIALGHTALVAPTPVPPPVATPFFSDMVRRSVATLRAADWKSFRTMCGGRLDLAVYSVPTSENVAYGMLFDDEYAPAENDILAFSYRGTQVSTSKEPTPFFLRQFKYFCSLVDGSCKESSRWPQSSQGATGLFNKNLGGAAAWGLYAPNAAWRVEYVRGTQGWTVKRLVVETQ
ncbi:MAG: hypothetical protein JST30_11575 [Armatimonadetes bacterium]|nr:hypothetical protein [Armatimonadota bacterium]